MRTSEHPLSGIRHFIWDFDGTLFDTYPVIIQNLRDALAQFGQDAEPAEAMKQMLNSIRSTLDFYAEKYAIDRDKLGDAYQEFHRQANGALAAPPIAGVQAVLQRICDTGRHNYIFTHRPLWETRAYLEKHSLSHLFRDLVGLESPEFSWKPAPDSILALMRKYQMAAEETLMIGDREMDLGSGRNAGVKTLHLVCRIAPEDLPCDWQLEDFGQMLAWL